ncbi:SPOR domain-containing protein [Flavobacterium sp.]|uniref:SPOR domain-containing protein n=1 Tax=Flavobacterium sp. TaxID=239 RepID=UPI0022CBB784|nr:SPOR domain-containing protein [Flavobacterium sp.]MCZ8230093.1 SPOR domain-containing protein [Flavobacterium sp.]
MKIISIKTSIILVFAITTSIAKLSAQSKKTIPNQDPKVDQLMNEKIKINNSLSINDRYKIQIFSGASDPAKKTLNDFKMENKNVDATIIFQTPNYKVWVGNYRTRMEAERNMIEFQKKYKNILLIKPSK